MEHHRLPVYITEEVQTHLKKILKNSMEKKRIQIIGLFEKCMQEIFVRNRIKKKLSKSDLNSNFSKWCSIYYRTTILYKNVKIS
jgi:hypothetical protein